MIEYIKLSSICIILTSQNWPISLEMLYSGLLYLYPATHCQNNQGLIKIRFACIGSDNRVFQKERRSEPGLTRTEKDHLILFAHSICLMLGRNQFSFFYTKYLNIIKTKFVTFSDFKYTAMVGLS